MANIIAVANSKGGVSKTTCALNIGAGLAQKKYKTLVVDLDPQCNLSVGSGVLDKIQTSIYDIMTDGANIEDGILNRKKNLDIIGSSLDLTAAEIELSGKIGRERILYKKILPIEGKYDYIIFDCPPNLGLLTVNALAASKYVLIPIQTEFYALHGLSKFMYIIKEVQSELNEKLKIIGFVATRYDGRKILNREVVESVKEYFGDKLMKTYIRENISIAEAPESGDDIFAYAPKSNGAEDYKSLVNELIQRIKNNLKE